MTEQAKKRTTTRKRKSAAKPKAGSAPPPADRDIYAFADELASAEEQAGEEREAPEAWVTFQAADQSYALPVDDVQEVLRVDHLTRVPQTPPSVRGVTNLRGRVLAVIDLPLRLGFDGCTLDDHSRILVVRHQGRPVGLLVDRIDHMAQVLPSTVDAPEKIDSLEHKDLLRGVAKLEDRLVALLSLGRVLELENSIQSQ